MSENSPSFTVDEENQRYKCYSCGRSGNVFDYVSEKKGLSFPQAVIEVARNVGIKIDSKYTENTGGHFNENELKLIELNKQASEIFYTFVVKYRSFNKCLEIFTGRTSFK
nr:CHC2 zinc finger domain-containing protein [Oenococcus oeni]